MVWPLFSFNDVPTDDRVRQMGKKFMLISKTFLFDCTIHHNSITLKQTFGFLWSTPSATIFTWQPLHAFPPVRAPTAASHTEETRPNVYVSSRVIANLRSTWIASPNCQSPRFDEQNKELNSKPLKNDCIWSIDIHLSHIVKALITREYLSPFLPCRCRRHHKLFWHN
jgi:hypothetical protein